MKVDYDLYVPHSADPNRKLNVAQNTPLGSPMVFFEAQSIQKGYMDALRLGVEGYMVLLANGMPEPDARYVLPRGVVPMLPEYRPELLESTELGSERAHAQAVNGAAYQAYKDAGGKLGREEWYERYKPIPQEGQADTATGREDWRTRQGLAGDVQRLRSSLGTGEG